MEKRAQNLSNMFRDQTEEPKRIETNVDLEAHSKKIAEKLQDSVKIYNAMKKEMQLMKSLSVKKCEHDSVVQESTEDENILVKEKDKFSYQSEKELEAMIKEKYEHKMNKDKERYEKKCKEMAKYKRQMQQSIAMHRKMIEDICHNPEAETKEQQDHLIMMHKAENKKYAEN